MHFAPFSRQENHCFVGFGRRGMGEGRGNGGVTGQRSEGRLWFAFRSWNEYAPEGRNDRQTCAKNLVNNMSEIGEKVKEDLLTHRVPLSGRAPQGLFRPGSGSEIAESRAHRGEMIRILAVLRKLRSGCRWRGDRFLSAAEEGRGATALSRG